MSHAGLDTFVLTLSLVPGVLRSKEAEFELFKLRLVI